MADADYAVKVNDQLESVELKLCGALGKNKQHGAHMRAFWASTISFFMAFVGWFALAPVAIEVCHSVGACENQLYSYYEYPERMAYKKFKNIKSGKFYCQYGKEGSNENKPTGCKPVPTDVYSKNECATKCPVNSANTVASKAVAEACPEACLQYNVLTLPKCVCTPGTHCASTILYSGIGSVGVTIFVRVALGTLLERFGPANVQSGLMPFRRLLGAYRRRHLRRVELHLDPHYDRMRGRHVRH